MNHSLRLKSQARIWAVALQLKIQSHSDDRYKKRWNSFHCDQKELLYYIKIYVIQNNYNF